MKHARRGLTLLLLALACDPVPWSEPDAAPAATTDLEFDLDPEAPLDLGPMTPVWPAP
jgi:hypothetical protein